jgi:hypothetical protein
VGVDFDRLEVEPPKAVKKSDEFRQVYGVRRKSCQKTLLIWTGLRDETEKLSKKHLYFDRLEG